MSNSKKQAKMTAKSKSRVTKKQNRVVAIAIVAIAVASIILFTGQLHTNPTNSTSLSIVQVSIVNGAGVNPNSPGYSPPNITIVIGINNTVKWVNYDSMAHTVTAVDGSFDSGNLEPGQSFVHTFNTPGTYVYVCIYHHWMQGTVIVVSLTNG